MSACCNSFGFHCLSIVYLGMFIGRLIAMVVFSLYCTVTLENRISTTLFTIVIEISWKVEIVPVCRFFTFYRLYGFLKRYCTFLFIRAMDKSGIIFGSI